MTDIQIGHHIVVTDCEPNRSNAFWSPLIGCSGSIIRIQGDGLIDVVLTTHDKYIIQPTGIMPTRFDITKPPSLWADRCVWLWKETKNYFKFP